MNRRFVRRPSHLVAALLVPGSLVLTMPTAQAALLGITPTYPDITTSSTDINYDFTAGSGGTLTINGSAGPGGNYSLQTVKFFSGDTAHNICQGTSASCNPFSTYSLTASFDASGLFTGGSLSIMGYVDGDTSAPSSSYQPHPTLANSGTLLTADLTGFGFSGTAGTASYDNLRLDFSIAATGGDFFTAYGSGNGLIWNGRVNTAGSATYGGNWDLQTAPMTQDFSCSGTACTSTLNTFIPLPAAVWLFGSGLAGLLSITRLRTKSAG